jgi:hypothetical protein
MSQINVDSTDVGFFDGSCVKFVLFGETAQVILQEANGREVAGKRTNAQAAYQDFLRHVERRARSYEPIDGALLESIRKGANKAVVNWDYERYRATVKSGGWTSFLLPRGLVALEKIGYRLVLENDHAYVVTCRLADNLHQIGGDITLIGAFADRELFVLYDGFLADHDSETTTRQRRKDLERKLASVSSIVLAPEAPAENERFAPSAETDVYVRRQTDPFTSMEEHRFESELRESITFEHVLATRVRDPHSPFISPLREG